MHSAAVEESSKRNLALPRIILHEMRVKDAFLTDLGPQSVARIAECSRNADAKTSIGVMLLGSPGARVATFRCAAPVRCGAFSDERRVVAGDRGDHRPACASLAASFAAGVAAWDAGGAIERRPRLNVPAVRSVSRGSRSNDNALFAPAPSVAPRPPVAARLPMSGTSLRRPRRPCADAKRSSSPAGSAASRLPPKLELDGMRLCTLARSSPPSVALGPRVAARSPMSGASLR
jgi:hypothetical protein